jgi:S-formylglutathione hydrolase FrmB
MAHVARRSLFPLLVIVLTLGWLAAPPASAQECTPGQDGCLPTSEQCATGEHNGVTLGETFMTAAVCAGSGGTTAFYAGGNANPTLLCGEIVVANQVVAEGDPNACADFSPMFPKRLPYRVILPADYGRSGKRYPVLYLLAGGGHDQNAWLSYDPEPGLLPRLANRGVIIVSVFTGLTFYTDWVDGRGDWETDFVERLVPTVDRTLRTVTNRSARAIAGFSMGAYGAAILTAHHPDLFSVVGSFSGPVDTFSPGVLFIDAVGPATGLGTYEDPIASPPWGNPVTNELWWRDANPVDHAISFRGTSVWISTGNAVPTPEDAAESGPFLPLAMQPEASILAASLTFSDALDRAGVEHEFRIHDGVHSARAAAQDLRDFFPWMLTRLGKKAPYDFDLMRATPKFSVYGWTIRADPRRAPEFLLTARVKDGQWVVGSGTTTVTTPAMFRPGERVSVLGTVEGNRPRRIRADRQGRLTFTVDLGPPNDTQQYSPQRRASLEGATGRRITFRRG